MKSKGYWVSKYPGMSTHMVGLIQADATADLQSQVEQLKAELERVRMVEFSCFECSDGSTPLYCLNCANTVLRTALEKCVVALESLRDHQNGCPLPSYEEGWTQAMRETDDALATAKPLLNKP